MPALAARCPDTDCAAEIGEPHSIECLVAVCVMTGQQRILHQGDELLPADRTLPAGIELHICGDDIWTGRHRGTDEAAAHGLFVRPADDPLTGWLPCPPGTPGAVVDLDRLVRSGKWNPIRQTWELLEPAR